MMRISTAEETDLREQQRNSGLRENRRDRYFQDLLANATPLSEAELGQVEQIRQNFAYVFEQYLAGSSKLTPDTVKTLLIGPLVEALGLYRAPFSFGFEAGVEVFALDEDRLVRGQINTLVVSRRLWLLAVESSEKTLETDAPLTYLLSYLSAAVGEDRPVFGLISNGQEFYFVRLGRSLDANSTVVRLEYTVSSSWRFFGDRETLHVVFKILKELVTEIEA